MSFPRFIKFEKKLISNQELQELLIEKIRKTIDHALLEDATRLLNIETGDSGIYVLSETEEADIEEARQQIKMRENFTHEKANQLINEWLNNRMI